MTDPLPISKRDQPLTKMTADPDAVGDGKEHISVRWSHDPKRAAIEISKKGSCLYIPSSVVARMEKADTGMITLTHYQRLDPRKSVRQFTGEAWQRILAGASMYDHHWFGQSVGNQGFEVSYKTSDHGAGYESFVQS